MGIRDNMEAALDNLFSTDGLGESITYNGDSITAIVDPSKDVLDETSGHRRVIRRSIEVGVSDVATPAYRDAVVIDSETWRVLEIEASDWYSHTLILERDERPVP